VELKYNDAAIQIKPSVAGFELDLEGMLTAADLQRTNQPFWEGFWDYLWNQSLPTSDIPLKANLAEDRLRLYLASEIATRYDQPPTPPIPLAGSTGFIAGEAGSVLNIDQAIQLIDGALRSPTNRVVNLSFDNTAAPRPSLQNLEILLQQIISLNNFSGIVDIYLEDLQTNETIHFGYQNGSVLPVQPDIAFSAISTIKIPIMISIMRRVDEPNPQNILDQMRLMIEESGNNPADNLMEAVMTEGVAPLEVTQDMQMLGLQNTFLGAYMAKPVFLKRIETPSNQRTDINADPDPFSQTTPSDIGQLLGDIYTCSENGGGALAAAFPGEISQAECQTMIEFLAGNKTVAILLQAGLPEGVRIAHKHAYATESDGLIHTMGDSGIIYSPGGNYIASVFLHHPVQVVWDPSNKMVAELSQAAYNYFNVK
jgi:beta-lactamase class A